MTALAETAPATESQPGDDHVLVLCHMLSNRISDVFEGEFAASEVTVPEWRVLLSVAGGDHINAQAIAARWAMNKMTVSRAIDSLVDRDLVNRSRNPLDRRVHDLGLDHLAHSPGRRGRDLDLGFLDPRNRTDRRHR